MIQQALRMSRLEAERARRGAAAGGAHGGGAPALLPDRGGGPTSPANRGALLGEEDPSLMAAIAASYAAGNARIGRQHSDEEIVEQAIRRSKNEEEARERERLRNEQATEYEESLRMDRQKEAEKAIRLKEEEE